MSGTLSQDADGGLMARFRAYRRRKVKRFGKKLVRRLADFMAHQSLVGNPPVFEAASFAFLKPFEDNWETVLGELREILKNRQALPNFHDISQDQVRISKGDNWKTFILFGFGYKSERSCAQCPETTRLLEAVPSLRSAWFSILAPGYHIPAHHGVTKGIVRVHLGLMVPRERERCTMRVGEEICHWAPGRCLVFDDTYNHEIWNDTEEERVVLLFDFDRPMRWPGRLFHAVFLRAIRWTAYVQDPKRNMATWEDRFEAAVRNADALTEGH